MTIKTYKNWTIEINRLGNRRYEYNVGADFRTWSLQDAKDYINRQIDAQKYLYAD
jgi:hypothetical protein